MVIRQNYGQEPATINSPRNEISRRRRVPSPGWPDLVRFCKLYTIERQIRRALRFKMGTCKWSHHGEGTSRREFLRRRDLWPLGGDFGRAGPARPDLSAVPPKVKKGEEWIEVGDVAQPGAELSGGDDLPPQPHGRLESHQRKEHRLGGQDRRQPGGGVRSAVHAPGLRLSLGRGQERIPLPLPQLPVLHRRQGVSAAPRPARWTATRPRSNGTKLLLGKLTRYRRRRRHEAAHTEAQRMAGRIAPAYRLPSRQFPLRRDPRLQRLAPGVRQRRACSCSWCRPSPARCWPSTTRPRRATPITACATS